MTSPLRRFHRRIYEGIYHSPVSSKLSRQDMRSMLDKLAEVVEGPDGNLRITRNGQTLVMNVSSDQNVAEVAELMVIRDFLDRSGAAASKTKTEYPMTTQLRDDRTETVT